MRYRHELKFLCGEADLCLVEERIRHICRPDVHAGQSNAYTVRSLYFDTYDDVCYQENKAGTDDRKKYRVRIYNADMGMIKLECKYSRHDLKAKEMCEVTRRQCDTLIMGGQTDAEQELLLRFFTERKLELLEPKVIVEYTRTPYIYPAGNVRITFDRDIKSSQTVSRFAEKSIAGRNVLPGGMHILEVKYDGFLPGAVLELLTVGGQFSLHRTSFSKYSMGRGCYII